MSLARCPRCRSAVNPARFACCIGCGADVRNVSSPAPRSRPTVLREGERDSDRTVGILVALGGLGLLGAFAGVRSGWLMMLSCGAGFIGVFGLLFRTLEGKANSAGPGCVRVAGAVVLCGVALLFGLGVIVGFVCLEKR